MLHRYVIVRQEDGSDCGAAALATIALHYRRPIRLLELRDLVGTDRGGAPGDVVDVLRRLEGTLVGSPSRASGF